MNFQLFGNFLRFEVKYWTGLMFKMKKLLAINKGSRHFDLTECEPVPRLACRKALRSRDSNR